MADTPPPATAGGEGSQAASRGADVRGVALLVSTLVIAVCGLIYELLAGTVSSYLVGDSVYQFSIVIGLFMAAMGIGSYLSRFAGEHLVELFVGVQILLGVIGGLSALGLFFAFAFVESYTPFLVASAVAIGALIGLEIPLVIRILRRYQALRLSVSNVLTADYFGALVASLAFPLVLIPQLGLIRTGVVFGLLNLLVAALAVRLFAAELRSPRRLGSFVGAGALVLFGALAGAERFTGLFEARIYGSEIILAESTPYQRIVITRSGSTVSLFLNGGLQFSSLDEYRYHESLVHPAMSLAGRRDQVLILGGGDGLAVREVLRHRDVANVTLVDLDPRMTELFSTNPMLTALNGNSLTDPRVTVLNADAWKFLEATDRRFDVAIIDLPDPYDVNLGRLYTIAFYALVARRLNADGVMVTQATSPTFAREAFWSIERTLAETPTPYALEAGLETVPYHIYVPAFGDWGFVLAAPRRLDWGRVRPLPGLRFLDAGMLGAMTTFSPDIGPIEVEPNRLETHALVRYYETGWGRWYE